MARALLRRARLEWTACLRKGDRRRVSMIRITVAALGSLVATSVHPVGGG